MSDSIKPIKNLSVTEQAINEIKDYLLSGELKAGDKILTENELSKKLCVGRSTVREAIRTLQAIGYIEIIPGRGAFSLVDKNTLDTSLQQTALQWFVSNETKLNELQEVRCCIEPFASKLAALRRSNESLALLRKSLDGFITNGLAFILSNS